MESFFVFVILECFALVYYILYFHYEPKQVEKKIWDPLGLAKTGEQVNVRRNKRRQ